MRYGSKCKLPDVVKKLPHVAFEVDDIYKAIKGRKVIISPNFPVEGCIVAFVLINNAPVEFIQFTNRDLRKKKKQKKIKPNEYNLKR